MRRRRAIRIIRRVALATGVMLLLAASLQRAQSGAAGAQSVTRTFSGSFGGSGTFSNSLCAWRTTYTGTVVLTLTFGSSSVTGTARHRGNYQDVLTSGPSECGGDLSAFDDTVPVSGSAQSLRWGFPHGEAGRVAAAGSLIGNAIVGQATVTDPDYTGSATIPFTANEIGSPASPGGTGSAPPAPPPVAAPPVAAPPVAAPPVAAPAAPASQPPSTSGAASGQLPAPASPNSAASGAAGISDPTVVPISPVPPVPPPRDVDPAARGTTRETCQNFSSDPALWQALEDHLDELDKLEVPITTAKGCIAMYRAQPWPARPGGATFVRPADEGAGKTEAGGPADRAREGEPVKATLETETALVLRAGEKGQSTTVRGASLGRGDTLVTRDGPATEGFSEGSRMEIGPKSAVVMGDPAEKSVVQLRGRLFMDIKSRQWVVRIPQPRGLVAVVTRGTKFSTEVLADGNIRVEVTESTVEVTSGGQTVAVRAGSSITVSPGEAPPPQPPEAVDSASGSTSPVVYAAAAAAVVVAAGTAAFVMRRRSRGRV